MGIQEKSGFPFFMLGVLGELDQFLGETSACPPLIGLVANTYPLHLRPSRVFQGHRFGRSKIKK